MAFQKNTSPIGNYQLVAGSNQDDSLTATGLQAAFGGPGNDSLTSYSTSKSGYKTIPFLVGGAGNDTYNLTAGSYAVIADIGGGIDTINAQSVRLSQIYFAVIDNQDILASDGSTGVVMIDPLGVEDKYDSIEYVRLYDGLYTAAQLYQLALTSNSFLGYTTYADLDKQGILNFSMGGLSVNNIDGIAESLKINNAAVDSSSSSSVNAYAISLLGGSLTGLPRLSQNSYDVKFYNLGGGRYGIQQKGKTTIDEITGLSSIQFNDQSISVANDVAATFNQIKGKDDVTGVVYRLYNAAFTRLPDAKGLENWINGNKAGNQTYGSTALEFSKSQEFKNRYGANVTDTQYITTLYNNVLGRAPDAAGLANYQSLLAGGKDRGSLLLDFSESPENRNNFTNSTGFN